MRRLRPTPRFSVGILIATAALLSTVTAIPAQAAFKRPLTETLTWSPTPINAPIGVAVDNDLSSLSHGEVYVVDRFNQRIVKFKENGTRDGEITSADIGGKHCEGGLGFAEPLWDEIDPANGDLYVVDVGHGGTLTAFSPSGECLFQTNSSNEMPKESTILGVAVDPKAGPDGTAYVSNRAPNPAIDEFDAKTGAFTGSFPVTQNFALVGMAVDPAGNVFLVDHNEPSNGLVDEYEPSTGKLLRVFDANNVQSVAVDPENGHIFVGENAETPNYQIAEFSSDTETSPQSIFGKGSFPSGEGGYGIGVNAEANTVYAVEGNGGNGYSVRVFGPGVIVPDVNTGEGLGVSHKITKLTGHVDPAGGGAIEECKFEYVEAAEYNPGAENPYAAGPPPVPCAQATPINAAEEVSAEVEGLKGETEYDFRLVAANAKGANQGGNKTFTSAPAVLNVKVIPPVTELERTSATLNGSLNPDGIETHYHFEYGTTECRFGGCTALPELGPLSNSPGAAGDPVSQHVANLNPETTYSYRLVAHNELGTTDSEEVTFTTPGAVFGVSTDPATEVNLEGATLNGSLNPDGIDTHYSFQYGIDENYGQTTATEDAGAANTSPNPSAPVKGIGITGLQPNHTYHYRIVASNSFGTTIGSDQTFKTPSEPTIGSLSSSHVTATSAELKARINPQGFKTEYHFEYGTTPSYGTSVPAPDAEVGNGTTDQSVSFQLEDLQPVTYHFRVVATNKWGIKYSSDQTFEFYPPNCPNAHVRQQTGAGFLPDCRAYELVSAAYAGGAIIFGGYGIHNDSPYADNTYAYGAGLGLIPNAGEPTNANVDRYVATRTSEGWVSHYVGVPGNKALGVGFPSGSTNGSEFLSTNDGDYEGRFSEQSPYLYSNEGELLGRLPTNHESVPGGEHGIAVETRQIGQEGNRYGNTVEMPSPDYSHYVFASNTVAYAENGVIGAPGSVYDNNVAEKTVTVVSKTASGDIPKGAGSDWTEEGSDAEYMTIPAISTDGSHILMATDGGVCNHISIYDGKLGHFRNICDPSDPSHLYMRVNDAVTYEIAEGHAVNFIGMTSDGSKVFFTSNEQLTADDTDHSTDLYMWSLENGNPSITRISTANNGAGNTDACIPAGGWTSGCGIVPVTGGLSERNLAFGADNSIASESGDVYFYSPEMLDGSKGLLNQQNLYVYREGQVHYVTTFSPGSAVSRINVSPDGSHMAFMTRQQITGYENHGYMEMYSWDPSSGELTCVSCNPSGAAPTSDVQGSESGLFMANDGRTFFYTTEALVPQDTDNIHDVYEYTEGRAQLITQGTGARDITITNNNGFTTTREATFLGVSADGINVYFSTFDVLVGQDQNGQYLKVYDARTDGGFPFVPISASCEAADECHGPGSSPPTAAQLGSTAELGNGGNYHGTTATTKKKHRKKHHKRKQASQNKTHRARGADHSRGGSR